MLELCPTIIARLLYNHKLIKPGRVSILFDNHIMLVHQVYDLNKSSKLKTQARMPPKGSIPEGGLHALDGSLSGAMAKNQELRLQNP